MRPSAPTPWLCPALVAVTLLGATACDARRSDIQPLPTPELSDGTGASAEALYSDLPEALRRPLLASHDPIAEVRLDALRLLERLAEPRILPRVSLLLDDDDSRVRCQAAQTLSALGVEGRPAAERLAEQLGSDPAAAVRQCALLALARVGGDAALQRLMAFLTGASPGDLEDAIDALGRLGRIEAVPALVEHLGSGEPSVVRVAIAAISRIGPGGAAQVRPYLESGAASARCAAASILARFESADDLTRLRRLSRTDGDRGVRICALGALGRLGDTEAVDELAEVLTSGSTRERAGAAEALGVAASGPAIRALIRALTVFHAEAAPNAAQAALLAIGAPARTALEEALPTGPPLRRALVAETLGLLGDPTSAYSLERAALDTDPTVREAALDALEILQGPGDARD